MQSTRTETKKQDIGQAVAEGIAFASDPWVQMKAGMLMAIFWVIVGFFAGWLNQPLLWVGVAADMGFACFAAGQLHERGMI